MNLQTAYQLHFMSPLKGRYITLKDIFPLINKNPKVEIFKKGISEKGKEIPALKIGNGTKKILAWSQMHGNESTTTKAVMDFLQLISQKDFFQDEISQFLDNNTLYLIPILNPDGAENYTRNNNNDVDLNRDAKNLTQEESVFLNTLFIEIQPNLCLNLHDQRTIYGLSNGKPATISFLSPAANVDRTITEARRVALNHIVSINALLQNHIPGQIGRYDDTFNKNCVGDHFTASGVPTILFEAGHYQNDYQREKTREFIFYSLLNLFKILPPEVEETTYEAYFDIPENKQNYWDVILKNVKVEKEVFISVSIQFEEILKNNTIVFIPIIKEVGDVQNRLAHKTIDVAGKSILINSQESINLDEKIYTICYKNTGKEIIL